MLPSPSARKVWIEIWQLQSYSAYLASPSARKVLIEILLQSCLLLPGSVTFCKEGVDWNVEMGYDVPKILVTFHKEGVDWNFSGHETKTSGNVTFRKEGVDWNNQINRYQRESFVTFRKEGVDWNCLCIICSKLGRCGLKFKVCGIKITPHGSPSAGKVWIEIWV